MMKRLIATTVLLLSWNLYGQQTQPDSVKYGWQNEIVGNVTLTQASFDNWQQGGESTFAWQAKLNSTFVLDRETFALANTVKFDLGFAKVSGEEARKAADQIFLESVYTRKLGRRFSPFFAITAKTQFAAGFEYDGDTKTKVSRFLDPGYFTQSLGVGYKPDKHFQSRLGLTIKETVTSDFPVPYADDPDTPEIEKTKVEPGISSITQYKRVLREDVTYTSKLDLFSDMEAFNRIDVLWENNLNIKVTKIINISFDFDLFYDRDISTRRQIKQVLGVGLTYTFL